MAYRVGCDLGAVQGNRRTRLRTLGWKLEPLGSVLQFQAPQRWGFQNKDGCVRATAGPGRF